METNPAIFLVPQLPRAGCGDINVTTYTLSSTPRSPLLQRNVAVVTEVTVKNKLSG
jgi:hypothetical protein